MSLAPAHRQDRFTDRSPRLASTAGPVAAQRAMRANEVTVEVLAGNSGDNEHTPAPAISDNFAGVVSLTPAVLSKELDLVGIARTYRTGFDNTSPIKDRFSLIIGVNYWDGKTGQEVLLKKKIDGFKVAWDKEENAFPVEVIGFTWHNDLARKENYNKQEIIPYGSIRGQILRHRAVSELIQGLKDRGREHVYLHTSDSDTKSFATDAGPLFSAATNAAVAPEKEGDQGTPAGPLQGGSLDVFSGGYTGRDPNAATGTAETTTGKRTKGKSPKNKDGKVPGSPEKDLMLWQAAQVDLLVRDAMARVNPRSVYYPEPNTFVKVKTEEDYQGLEEGISFGESRQEGDRLVDSVRKTRTGTKDEFDSRYAITTDMGRIGQSVKTEQYKKNKPVNQEILEQLSELTQSHASKTTWQDRVEKAYTLPPGMKAELGKHVYADVYDPKTFKDGAGESTIQKALLEKIRADAQLLESLKSLGTPTANQVTKMAIESRKALLTAFARAYEELSHPAP